MRLEIHCAMCGAEKVIPIKADVVDGKISLAELIRGVGWITQQNGTSFDVYCCNRCAQ